MTSNNMYRVGDFVYFEVTAAEPYQIRKIEELNKTNTGAVEAKVVCFYRRRDLSQDLVQLADKHHNLQQQSGNGNGDCLSAIPGLQTNTARQLHHRELFLSHHLETLPATHIRGKCTVTLHSDTDPWQAYLSREDCFFYQLVYDPLQKTLQADRGVIRQGPDYQAEVGDFGPAPPKYDSSTDEVREELLWRPDNGLDPSELEHYILLSRSLATLGRAFHPISIVRQPSMTMSMATANRDSTLQLALDSLHSAGYSVIEALTRLAPDNQPALRLDELEQWSASEGNLFEEALEKYGKAFYDIQADFLPWKPPKSVIQFYYLWKTTDHYVQQRRLKASQAEHHLKQVYIPNYNKPNTSVLYPTSSASCSPGCEACPALVSPQWFALGPSGSLLLKVCADCWAYWKRYADLKTVSLQDKLCNRSLLSKPTGLPGGSSPVSALSPAVAPPPPADKVVTSTTTGNRRRDEPAMPSSAPATSSNQLAASGFAFIASPHWRAARASASATPVNSPRRRGRCPFRAIDPVSGCTGPGALPSCRRAYVARRSLQQVVKRFSSGLQALSHTLGPASVKRETTKLEPQKTTIPETPPSTAVNGTLSSESSGQISIEHTECTDLTSSHKRIIDTIGHRPLVGKAEPETTSDGQESSDRVPVDEEMSSKRSPARLPACGTTSTTIAADQLGPSPSLLVGPKRRVYLGGEHGPQTTTVMFRCHEALKRSRRRLLSIADLRYLGRRPLRTVFQPSNTVNNTTSVGGPCKSKSLSNPSVNGLVVGRTASTSSTAAGHVSSTSSAYSTTPTAVSSPSKISPVRHVTSKTNGTEEKRTSSLAPSRPLASDS